MKGLAKHTKRIFEPLSKLDGIKDYFLIGGTALSIQLGHRYSEDLDFCRWSQGGSRDDKVDWPRIKSDLEAFCEEVKEDVLDFNQVNFLSDKVKLSFYINKLYMQPQFGDIISFNHIRIPDLQTLGSLKLEVMLRRSNFRDYYDIYSILKEDISLAAMVSGARSYSGHILKTKGILNFISNGNNFRMDSGFSQLKPVHDIDSAGIEEYIKYRIKSEYPAVS